MRLPLRLRLAFAVAATAALTMVLLYVASGWVLEKRFRDVATQTAAAEAEDAMALREPDRSELMELATLWREMLGDSATGRRIASLTGEGSGAVPLLVTEQSAVVVPLDRSKEVRVVDPAEVDGPLAAESVMRGVAFETLDPKVLDGAVAGVAVGGPIEGPITDVPPTDPGALSQPGVIDPYAGEMIGPLELGGAGGKSSLATTQVAGFDTLVWIDTADSDAAAMEIRRWILQASPLVALAAGVLAYLVSRWALGPVDRLTRQVAAIDARSLDERVPSLPSGDEVGRLAATLNGMLDRLQSSADAQSQFVADASHELRSPVAVLQHAAVLADGGTLNPNEMSGLVATEAARLNRLVDDLLVLARNDAGPSPSGGVELDLDDLVLDEAARPRATAVNVGQVKPAKVRGSAESVRRVVGHLLDNAARHAESQVVVGLDRDDGRVVLTVDDDGAGVAVEDRRRIFERFVRLDEARTRDEGGAGLGLAVVAATVERLGGSVEMGDSPSGGARVTVRLPDATPSDP